MDKEIKLICVDAMTNGLSLPKGLDIIELTADIWEKVNSSSRPMFANFKIYGNSSKINIINEDESDVMEVYVGPDSINFSLTKAFSLYTELEKKIAGWATFEVVGLYSQIATKKLFAQSDSNI